MLSPRGAFLYSEFVLPSSRFLSVSTDNSKGHKYSKRENLMSLCHQNGGQCLSPLYRLETNSCGITMNQSKKTVTRHQTEAVVVQHGLSHIYKAALHSTLVSVESYTETLKSNLNF